MSALPDGFVLEGAPPPPSLPSGFMLEQPAETSTLADVAKSFPAGIARGAIGLAGMPGDVRDIALSALPKPPAPQPAPSGLYGKVVSALEGARNALELPTSAGIQNKVKSGAGPLYEPQTTAGKYAQTAGEFLPAAAGGEGSIGSRLLKMVAIPSAASEAAGELTQGTAAEPYARIGAAFAAPAITGIRLPAAAATSTPRAVENIAGVDVPLSAGQRSGDTTQQILENASLRGARGQPAQQVADQFFNQQQAPAIETARGAIGQGLDRFGQNVVDNPQEAGELVGERVGDIARNTKQEVRNLYDEAFAYPGEFHAGTFEGIGQKIKGDLSLSRDPVIVDDVTTPVASRAIQHIDNTIGQLRVQNRADPFGAPSPENIVGINLQGVDQARKQLISMASGTERGSADHRAMTRIIGSFDNHVENGINNGLFSGDDRALDAIRDAREAYSNYRKAFTTQGAGDDVGRAMERIIGKNGQQGATPTEVANFLYGNAKVGGTGLSVRLAQRLQNVLGNGSPEWAAIRQGLWSRLSEATEGTTEFGAQKSANRISEFLNGSGRPLSQIAFNSPERELMARYAGLQRQLIPKVGAVNYSNSGVLWSALKGTANSLATMFGAAFGGPVGALAGYAAGPMGKKLQENLAARALSRSLYTPQRTPQATPSAANPNALARAVLRAAVARQADQRRQPAPSF